MAADDAFYKLLGVPKDADDDAIKKAYKKMSLKHHPDRNIDNKASAEKKFKQYVSLSSDQL